MKIAACVELLEMTIGEGENIVMLGLEVRELRTGPLLQRLARPHMACAAGA